ncbi:MAG TPA: M56 family metallopeptidase, partial [Gemmatimonadota bacterium]|nr:M56 family metallopeptidase [Gemmatimonadota bacterium]
MDSLLLDVTIKGTLVLLATCAAVFALRGASAATRHAIWTVGMAGALALPILSQLLPAWSVDLLPAQAISAPATAAPAADGEIGIDRLLALVWLAGAAVVFASIALGRFRIWWIARRSVPLDRGEIPALTTALCGSLGISRPVSVRLSRERMMPMVWGAFRPVILLPTEATSWTAELRRDVLLHELAHVRRHDYLNQLVTRFACAVHWFNPLVWLAARRLRAERERACDDHVLGTGASACDY